MSLMGILHDKLGSVFSPRKAILEYNTSPLSTPSTVKSRCEQVHDLDMAMERDYAMPAPSSRKRTRAACNSLSPLKQFRATSEERYLHCDQNGDVEMSNEMPAQVQTLDENTWREIDDIESASSAEQTEEEDCSDNDFTSQSDIELGDGTNQEHGERDQGEEREMVADLEDAPHNQNSHGQCRYPQYVNYDLSRISGLVSKLSLFRTPTSVHRGTGDGTSVEQDSTAVLDNSWYDYNHTPSRHYRTSRPPAPTRDVTHHIAVKRDEGWPEPHLTLLQRLYNRGKEPILPLSYQKALNFMPDNLFVPVDKQASLGARNTTDFHGERYLTRLLNLGGYIRSSQHNCERPEKQLTRFLEPYMRWAGKDTGMQSGNTAPIVALIVPHASFTTESLQRKTMKHLESLAARHRQVFHAGMTSACPQTLYAILAVETTVFLLAYPIQADGTLHNIASYDFSNKEYDVWNAIALALIVCHGRDVQIQIAGDAHQRCNKADPKFDHDPDA